MRNPHNFLQGFAIFELNHKLKDMAKVKEIWLDIIGFDGYYQISNKGRLKSLPRWGSPKTNILETANNGKGYLITAIGYKRKLKSFVIHRLVAIYFVVNPDPINYKEINHIDGNKKNNHASNLEWSSRSKNVQHAFDTGLKFGYKGSKHPKSILNEEQVLLIRSKHVFRKYSHVTLAKEFSVSKSTIKHILARESWKHI